MFAVNCKSIFLTARHVIPVMQKGGGGNIVNIASTAGIRPRPGLTWYNATKGAAITMTSERLRERFYGDIPLAAEANVGENWKEAHDPPPAPEPAAAVVEVH